MNNLRIVPTYVVKRQNSNDGIWERVSVAYSSREYALEVMSRIQGEYPVHRYTVVTVNTSVWAS